MSGCCSERITLDQLSDQERQQAAEFERQQGVQLLEMERDEQGQVRPTLINGKVVDREEWLEVVRIGNRSCTGTIIGDRAVLTAAHCGRNRSRSTLEIFERGRLNYTMLHHPSYRSRGAQYDVALLVLDQEIPPDITPSTVGINHNFRQGQDVDILGYGCTRPGGGGGNDGLLRFGESKVIGTAGTDIVTRHRPNGGALCFGDSGGPMFADGSNVEGATRRLIAVNSKGNIRDTNYNMRLDLQSVEEWLHSMADQHQLEIYGINAGGPEPEPDPEPDPEPGDQFAKQVLEWSAKLVDLAESELGAGQQGTAPGQEPDEPNPIFGR